MPENSEPGSPTPGSTPAQSSAPSPSAQPAPPPSTSALGSPQASSIATAPPPFGPPPPPAVREPRIRWWTWRTTNVVFPRSTLLAAVAVGVVGAIFWRISDLGIGVTVAGIAALAAVLITAPADFRSRMSPYWTVVTVGVVGLLAVPTFRAAGWVSAFCLFAALVAAAVLFVEAKGIRGLWLAAMSPVFAPALAFAAAFRRPPRAKSVGARPSLILIAVVAATTVLLLIVFGALFASADATFGSLFEVNLSSDIGPTVGTSLFCGVFLGLFTLGGALLVTQGTRYPTRPRPHTPIWAWAVPVGALFAMFLLFLGVQATAMFGGDDFVQRTADLTYSEYAVQGFWQLLAVGVLVIGVTVSAWHFVDVDDPQSRLTARILLGGLCVATLAVGASAIHRMTGYVNAYGMTEERIFGIFVELLVGIVMVGFLVAGARMSTAGLTKSIVVLGLFATLGFALFNPERYIASYNLDRYEANGKLDAFYLGGLSADAASQFDRLPTDLRACVDWRYARNHDADPSWREFSFSRYHPGTAADDPNLYYNGTCHRTAAYR